MHRLRLALLIVTVAWLLAPVTTEYPGRIAVFNVTDARFGAVADAVPAYGGAGCNNLTTGPLGNPPQTGTTCTTDTAGTDNSVAFQAAWTAACAATAAGAGSATIFTPAGSYLAGGADPTRTIYPSTDCENVHWTGEGLATKIYTAGGTGATGYGIFSSAGKNANGLVISHMFFGDPDPEAHGHNYHIIDEGTLTSDTQGTFSSFEEHGDAIPECTAAGAPLACCTGAGTGCATKIVTAASHGLTDGEHVLITGDVHGDHDGRYYVAACGATCLYIGVDFVQTDTGTWEVVPVIGDAVTWNGGTESGIVVRYDETLGILRIDPTDPEVDNVIETDDDVTSGDWTAEDVGNSILSVDTNEESHGIELLECDNCEMHHCQFDGFGDEAVQWNGDGFQFYRNLLTNIPGTSSGGSGLTLYHAGTRPVIEFNTFEGGVGGIATKLIALEVNGSTPLIEPIIRHNSLIDTSTTAQDSIDEGIRLHPTGGDIISADIDSNTFELNAANFSIYQSENSNAITGLKIRGNIVEGVGFSIAQGNVSNVVIENNPMDGSGISINRSMMETGDNFQIKGEVTLKGNYVYRYPGRCVMVATDGNDEVIIDNNDFREAAWSDRSDTCVYFLGTSANPGKILNNRFFMANNAVAAVQTIYVTAGLTEIYIEGNTIDNSDHDAINGGRVIKNNTLSNGGQNCIETAEDDAEIMGNTCDTFGEDGILVSGDDGVVQGNILKAITDDGIEVASALRTRVLVNTIEAAGDKAIIDSGTSALTYCYGNTSKGTTYTTFTLNDGDINNGPIAIGDAVELEGAAGNPPQGVVVSATAGTPGTYIVIPDDVTTDDFDNGDLLQQAGGGWDTDAPSITVSVDALAAPIIDCGGAKSVKAGNQDIPGD